MGIDVNKLMRKNKDGTKEQFYPETTVSAVDGLSEALGEAGKGAVTSVNGKVGAVNLTAADIGLNENGVPYASETQDGIITKEMYQKLVQIINSDPSGITVEKVE
ncbi:hypothetical protein [Carnobacterium maltaromaticum]|uniref:hypothetical protein n=1 Tax=Carnobacterium maltaromaticum TaxID=2751 RepID=UPI001072C427|nr:hypothetical protein [Carnobacterium maltaromaticum]TFJ76312.1 hypothetical protein CKN94_02795 [Carnobacterium maltaromaticum]TFJ79112.1 hypothetical protein CKN97_02790 [Carnobacterium maltaromaticum]